MSGANKEVATSGATNTIDFLDKWMREKSLVLRTESWRVFVDCSDADTCDRSSVEFTCKWDRGFATDQIYIGSLREPLDSIPLTLTIHRATPSLMDDLKADNASRKAKIDGDSHHRTEFVGLAQYREPLNSRDGVVNDKHGFISGWFAMGPDSFDYIRSVLTRSDVPDFAVRLTLRFPKNESEWSENEHIDIVNARFVFPMSVVRASDITRR